MILLWSVLVGLGCAAAVGAAFEYADRGELERRIGALLEPARVRKKKPPRGGELNSFPDFLDLLALGLSAGLTVDRSWEMAVQSMPAGALAVELADFNRSVEWGRSRVDAFADLSERLGDDRIRMVIALICQSMRRGSRLQDVLTDQARALRERRLVDMERRAQTAGLRLLFPIFLFILPTVFLILFAPLVIRLSQGMSLF